jgi:diguanylate cyclase (GGDEF)-like protein
MVGTWRSFFHAHLGPGAVLDDLRDVHRPMFRTAAVLRAVLSLVLSATALIVCAGKLHWLVQIALVLNLIWVWPISRALLRRFGMIPPWRFAIDLLVLVAFGLIAEPLRLVAALTALMVLAYLAVILRLAATVAIGIPAAIGFVALGIVDRDVSAVVAGLSMPATVFCVAVPARSIARQARAVEEANRAISRELGLVIWQASGNSVTPTHLYGDTMALHGFDREFFMTADGFESLLHPDDVAVDAAMNERIAAGLDYRTRYRLRCADGTYKWIEEVAHVVTDERGERLHVQGITFDVSEQVRSSEERSQLDSVLNSVSSGVVVMELVDPADPMSLSTVIRNSAAEQLPISDFEVGAPVRLRREWRRLSKKLAPPISEAILSGTPTVLHDVHFRHAEDGREIRFAFHVTPTGHNRAAVVIEDLTELYRTQAALRAQLDTDDLTGLASRSLFRRAVDDAGAGAIVAMLDLDQFKEINDAFGHDQGDQVLIHVGEALRGVPDGVLVARLGGDEFALLVDPQAAETFSPGSWIGKALSAPLHLDSGLILHVAGSVGVACKESTTTATAEVLRRADVAMYLAKHNHSGFELYSAGADTAAPRKMTLLGELPAAIDGGQLILHYQPIIDSRTRTVARLEGLLRWQHPTLGLLPPAEFIELTELNNLNHSVVMATLRRAIADAGRWTTNGAGIPISINIAGTTLHDMELVEEMIRELTEAKVERHQIGLELTERQLHLGAGASVESLRRLAAAGFWLSVDDFGTGTSSLSALRHIPANELKIDKSFLDDLRSGDSPLIRSIVRMAHDLHLVVVAEGIEDESTFAWLRSHGADQAQGYHFARPCPPALLDNVIVELNARDAEAPRLSVVGLDEERRRRAQVSPR